MVEARPKRKKGVMKRTALITAAGLVFAACASAGGEPATGTIEVTAQDYSFSGVPDLVATGAELTLTNASDAEAHEMVVFRIADVETRTIEELLEVPDEESESLFSFVGHMLALPGEEGFVTEGEGSAITLSDPGRYALVCFVPQGADPAALAEAIEGGAEPDLGDGTPHALLGMVEEFQVEEA